MNAKKCDRCKKLYEDYRDEETGSNAIRLMRRKAGESLLMNEFFDLCPACMESFKNWLKEGERA